MTRKEIINMMRKYKENIYIIKKMNNRIKDIIAEDNEVQLNLTSQYGVNNDIRAKNKTSDKVFNAVLSLEKQHQENKEKIENFKSRVKELTKQVEEVEDFLEALDGDDCKIVKAFYVENIPMRTIINEIYFDMYDRTCEPKTIYSILGKSIDSLLETRNKELSEDWLL